MIELHCRAAIDTDYGTTECGRGVPCADHSEPLLNTAAAHAHTRERDDRFNAEMSQLHEIILDGEVTIGPMSVMQNDIAAVLRALNLGDHSRDASPHEVMVGEVVPAIERMRQEIDTAVVARDVAIANRDAIAAEWEKVTKALRVPLNDDEPYIESSLGEWIIGLVADLEARLAAREDGQAAMLLVTEQIEGECADLERKLVACRARMGEDSYRDAMASVEVRNG